MTMKQDEKELLIALCEKRTAENPYPYVRQLVRDLNMNAKRAAYILDKWTGKGWYNYGVSVMAGWLTDEGRAQKPQDLPQQQKLVEKDK